MSYTITKSDGSTLATVADGTINATVTSLVLIGKNYAGYGVFLNENYVRLLENFAYSTAPSAAMTGQLWYDTSNKVLKVYDASITQWKPISSSASGATAPLNPVVGDLWWDSVNSQLKVWSGATWVTIGPVYTATAGTSGALPETILDTTAGSHVVIKMYVSNTVVGIISKDATFTPQTAIAGFSTIRPGFNLVSSSSIAGAQFTGEVSSALTLQGLPSAAFLRKDIAETATLPFTAAGGLTVGAAGAGLQIDNSNVGEVRVNSLTAGKDLALFVNTGAPSPLPALKFFGANAASLFSGAVNINGTLTTAGATTVGLVATPANLTVTGFTNLNNTLFANAVTATTLTASGTATFNGTTVLVGAATTTAGITPTVANAASLGTTATRFANVWAHSFRGQNVSVTENTSTASLTVSGAATAGSMQVNGTLGVTGASSFTGILTAGNILTGTSLRPVTTGTVDIGNTTHRYSTIWAQNLNITGTISGSSGISGVINGTTGSFSGPLTVNTSGNAVAIINGASPGVGNIGQAGAGFNTIFAKATSAQYADLAERFAADDYYQPGTVVEIGGVKEITRALKDLSEAVFGVISTLPGFLMNDKTGSTELNPPVAVNGRVPVRVIGKVNKGDRLVSAGNGLARAGNRNEITAFNVIGRALENKDTDGEGLVEAIVKLNS